MATGLPTAACRCPASCVRCRQVSFVISNRCLVWVEAAGRALVIRGAFDQDCSLYTRVGDPDRHSPPNRPFSYPAVGRTLVILLFPYPARHDTQCSGAQNSNRNPNDKKIFFFSLFSEKPSLACPVFSILACNKCLLCVLGLFRLSHVSNQDRMSREGRTKRLPLADALHLGPSKLFRPCRVDPMRETPERSVAEGKVPNPFTHMAAGRQASRSGFKLRLVVSLLVGC